VGFNPFRKGQSRTADFVMVAVAAVVIALLIAWAAIPR
jgi:hypothetical protein